MKLPLIKKAKHGVTFIGHESENKLVLNIEIEQDAPLMLSSIFIIECMASCAQSNMPEFDRIKSTIKMPDNTICTLDNCPLAFPMNISSQETNGIRSVNWVEMAEDSCKLNNSWGVYVLLPEENDKMELVKKALEQHFGDRPSVTMAPGLMKNPLPLYMNFAQEIFVSMITGDLHLMSKVDARIIMNIFNQHGLYKEGYCALFNNYGQCLDENR